VILDAKRTGTAALRLLVILGLAACPTIGSAAGTWSVIPLPQQTSDIISPLAVAVDAVGNLYVTSSTKDQGQIYSRNTEGYWSVIATAGSALGHVGQVSALAVDAASNLYVADDGLDDTLPSRYRIQSRDVRGDWKVIATTGLAVGQVYYLSDLAVDSLGNVYVADWGSEYGRIQQKDTQDHWSLIATSGCDLGQVASPSAVAVDTAGNLYVAGYNYDCGRFYDGRIEQRNAQGKWTLIAPSGSDLGRVFYPQSLAVDSAGNLYVAEAGRFLPERSRIQKRDAAGHWSVIASAGAAIGQVNAPMGLAVDGAGNLYMADTGNNRVLKYTPEP
jgi:sugar lactone lactonase YvrE